MNTYTVKDIAVVVLNWNGSDLLRKFLPSVIKHSSNAPIYVIDNASDDDSLSVLSNDFPEVSVIRLDDNLGYAGGYNKGLKSLKESIFCCLNSDVEVSPNWLDPILESYNTDEEIAVIQPKLIDYHNREYYEYAGAAGGFIDKYGYPYCRGRLFTSIKKDLNQYPDQEIFWASGACFFVRSSVFRELEGFDEDFFAHMEEIDFCWRAFNTNYKIYFCGDSKVYHVGGSTLSNSSPRKTFLNFRNSLFALTKNSPSPFYLLFTRLVLDGLAGIRFISLLQFDHFLAIIKAHLSFYSKLSDMLKKRKTIDNKRSDYYKINSIVWKFFIQRSTKF